MKILIGAIALLVAAPAAAQAAPNPHAGHAQQQGHDQHGQKGHSEHGQAGHDKHMACCKDGKHGECCKEAKPGETMKCCADKAAAKGADHSAHHSH